MAVQAFPIHLLVRDGYVDVCLRSRGPGVQARPEHLNHRCARNQGGLGAPQGSCYSPQVRDNYCNGANQRKVTFPNLGGEAGGVGPIAAS